jgi:hypothetical protein
VRYHYDINVIGLLRHIANLCVDNYVCGVSCSVLLLAVLIISRYNLWKKRSMFGATNVSRISAQILSQCSMRYYNNSLSPSRTVPNIVRFYSNFNFSCISFTFPNIKFHEKPSSESRVTLEDGRKDRERNKKHK